MVSLDGAMHQANTVALIWNSHPHNALTAVHLSVVHTGRELSSYHVEVVAELLNPPPLVLLRALLAVVAGRSHVQDRLCSCFAALR